MKWNLTASSACLALAILLSLPARGQTPLGTSFTYQGKLDRNGGSVDASADFQFRLFNAASGGAQVGSTQAVSNVNVVEGLFTVSLDFGGSAFNGDARFLDIAVRSPAGVGAFSTLTPRQTISASPYALKVPGVDGHSLDAADGSPVDALFVDNTGNIGIGTNSPTGKLCIDPNGAGRVVIGSPVTNGGGRTSLILGVSAASNGFGSIQSISAAGSSYGALALNPEAGNVGIGTSSPAAKLDVHGDVKLGSSGQYFAPGGEEKLRIVRGNIDGNGTIRQGSGFTSIRLSEGVYLISLSAPFADTPSITVTCHRPGGDGPRFGVIDESQLQPGFFRVEVFHSFSPTAGFTDSDFSFTAVGSR